MPQALLSALFTESSCRCSPVDWVLSFHYTFSRQMLERANFWILHAASRAPRLHRRPHSLLFLGVINVESIQNGWCGWELWRILFFFFGGILKSQLKTGNTSGTAAFLGCWCCLLTSPRSWPSHTWLSFLLSWWAVKFETNTTGKFWSISNFQADLYIPPCLCWR